MLTQRPACGGQAQSTRRFAEKKNVNTEDAETFLSGN